MFDHDHAVTIAGLRAERDSLIESRGVSNIAVVPERPALPAGAVVGAATLDRVLTLAEALADRSLADQRRYINGPVCLVLRDAVDLARPVPARGFLGFWPLSDTAAADVAAQLGAVS